MNVAPAARAGQAAPVPGEPPAPPSSAPEVPPSNAPDAPPVPVPPVPVPPVPVPPVPETPPVPSEMTCGVAPTRNRPSSPVGVQPTANELSPGAPMSDETTAMWMLGRPPGSASSAVMNAGICAASFCCIEVMDDELSIMNRRSRLPGATAASPLAAAADGDVAGSPALAGADHMTPRPVARTSFARRPRDGEVLGDADMGPPWCCTVGLRAGSPWVERIPGQLSTVL